MYEKEKNFKKWLIIGGLFNILVSTLYIFPFSVELNISLLSLIHNTFSLSGTLPSHTYFEPLPFLYINGFGIVDVSLGILLLYNAKDIQNRSFIAFVDAIARALFACIMIYYVVTENITAIAFFFALIEIGFAYVYIRYVLQLQLLRI